MRIPNTEQLTPLSIFVRLQLTDILSAFAGHSIRTMPKISLIDTSTISSLDLSRAGIGRQILEHQNPCMLEIGGLIHDKTPSGKDLVVHTGSYLNPWIAVRSVGNRFEIYPVAIDALGRRRALEVAAGYIQEICTLCPFQDLCDPKPYPYYSLGMKEKDRFPAVQANF